jgi:hypothetical protein
MHAPMCSIELDRKTQKPPSARDREAVPRIEAVIKRLKSMRSSLESFRNEIAFFFLLLLMLGHGDDS